MKILHNHVGFRPEACKTMIVQSNNSTNHDTLLAELIHVQRGEVVATLSPVSSGEVPGWKERYFSLFEFSNVRECGTYRFALVRGNERIEGQEFKIATNLADSDMISDLLFYFKGQRCSGRWDETDRQVPFYGKRKERVDVHGGWYDASGDYSKYLSHLSYANFLNPQQIPLVVWILFQLGETLRCHPIHRTTLLEERAFEEGMWGADFLMRMQDPSGYFYMTVFDQWNKKSESRMICAFKTQKGERLEEYQAGFRQGGGMAIAALAYAARFDRKVIPSDGYTSQEYLEASIKGYDHLVKHNGEYLDNGQENIIDCYCALMATVELFLSTNNEKYRAGSRSWTEKLGRHYSHELKGWIAQIGLERPFYHASDTGLAIVALLRYLSIENDERQKKAVARLLLTLLHDELERASAVYNPFLLSRQMVQSVNDTEIRPSFFVPHDNESGYWWQGENARLASMISGARMAALHVCELYKLAFPHEDTTERASHLDLRLRRFADAHFDWILGCNPFDISMMQGHGRNNPRYEEHAPNAPGGICNGITGGFEDERDIDFLPQGLEGRGDQRWRWSEQWIPHGGWFLMALAMRLKLEQQDAAIAEES